jgi:hypothetical protein
MSVDDEMVGAFQQRLERNWVADVDVHLAVLLVEHALHDQELRRQRNGRVESDRLERTNRRRGTIRIGADHDVEIGNLAIDAVIDSGPASRHDKRDMVIDQPHQNIVEHARKQNTKYVSAFATLFDNDRMNDVPVAVGVALTTDLSHDESIPYFLWDEPMTVRELRDRLERSEADRIRLLGKILREARENDVWQFTTVEEVVRRWDQLERFLGRRKDFWQFLLSRWREQGLLS